MRVPDPVSPERAAAIGTAGFTAMLAILELERDGVDGDVLVTGATGGVGSIAVAILARTSPFLLQGLKGVSSVIAPPTWPYM